MNEKKVKRPNIFIMLFTLIPFAAKVTPYIFTASIITHILSGVFIGVVTMTQQRFFDRVTGFSINDSTLGDVLTALLIMGLSYIINQVLDGVANLIQPILIQKVNGKLLYNVHTKTSRLDPIDMEDTKKLDDINKAIQGKDNAVLFIYTTIKVLAMYIPYFIFMGWYLFRLKPLLVGAIVLVFIPIAATQLVRAKVHTNAEDKAAPVRREYEYYESCITGREYYKETRLLGGFQFFKKMYIDALHVLQELQWKATIKSNNIELGMRMLTVTGYFGILWMLFDLLMKQEISLGAFAAVFTSIRTLYNLMENMILRNLATMAKDYGTIQNYINFINLEERKGIINEVPDWGDIELHHVNFTYPGADKEAVKDASFTLKKGETIAIVGENGSGKSTLIRLLTGLYRPSTGTVKVNGVDTRELTNHALFENTSAVFQKYQRYQMTLEDNITISRYSVEHDDDELDLICEMAGTDKDNRTFKDGYKTMLSREFDGVDLSGGQWQRVAIARGFFRNHNFIVLDEPTAAIDPYEETKIYNRFAEISRNKSAVIVTHRLGSVKLADRIIVMKDAKIEEIGTHEELLKKGKEYTRLYKAQQQWYKDKINPC
ncbi:MAG: hypothetical protein K0S76_1757 [Herbinix sp.]|jgi:ATP-binding cassette subfamily B protein|nr:hypothetical protein [Herbinix sp.]